MSSLKPRHYSDVIMGAMASQITGVSIVYSTVCSDANQRKHQSSTSLAFVRAIHRLPGNSPHKGPVTRIFFPFHDVIMETIRGGGGGGGGKFFTSTLKMWIGEWELIHYRTKRTSTWCTRSMCSLWKPALLPGVGEFSYTFESTKPDNPQT